MEKYGGKGVWQTEDPLNKHVVNSGSHAKFCELVYRVDDGLEKGVVGFWVVLWFFPFAGRLRGIFLCGFCCASRVAVSRS